MQTRGGKGLGLRCRQEGEGYGAEVHIRGGADKEERSGVEEQITRGKDRG